MMGHVSDGSKWPSKQLELLRHSRFLTSATFRSEVSLSPQEPCSPTGSHAAMGA